MIEKKREKEPSTSSCRGRRTHTERRASPTPKTPCPRLTSLRSNQRLAYRVSPGSSYPIPKKSDRVDRSDADRRRRADPRQIGPSDAPNPAWEQSTLPLTFPLFDITQATFNPPRSQLSRARSQTLRPALNVMAGYKSTRLWQGGQPRSRLCIRRRAVRRLARGFGLRKVTRIRLSGPISSRCRPSPLPLQPELQLMFC